MEQLALRAQAWPPGGMSPPLPAGTGASAAAAPKGQAGAFRNIPWGAVFLTLYFWGKSNNKG